MEPDAEGEDSQSRGQSLEIVDAMDPLVEDSVHNEE